MFSFAIPVFCVRFPELVLRFDGGPLRLRQSLLRLNATAVSGAGRQKKARNAVNIHNNFRSLFLSHLFTHCKSKRSLKRKHTHTNNFTGINFIVTKVAFTSTIRYDTIRILCNCSKRILYPLTFSVFVLSFCVVNVKMCVHFATSYYYYFAFYTSPEQRHTNNKGTSRHRGLI